MKEFPNPLRAMLVDFDGTLVDSMSALWDCFKEFLGQFDIKATEEEFTALVGPSLLEVTKKLQAAHSLPGSLETLYANYTELVRRKYVDSISLFPNALRTLHKAKTMGIKLALVTSAPAALVENVLTRHSILKLFDALITGLPDEPPKPHPAIYLRALKTLGVHANHTLAIEDSHNGISSAQAADLYVIQFRSPGRSSPDQGILLAVEHWDKIGEALYGYQTFEISSSFELKVEDSGEKLNLSDVEEGMINQFWEEAQKQRGGKLFNGKLLSYLRLEQEKLIAQFVDYRYYIAQLFSAEFKKILQIQPIAISCICMHQNKVLVGKRSCVVTEYPGYFELVPSGGIEPSVVEHGKVDLIKQALIELEEEAGITSNDVQECSPRMLARSLITRCYEICMQIKLREQRKNYHLQRNNDEYSQLKWMQSNQLEKLVKEKREMFVPLSLLLIDVM